MCLMDDIVEFMSSYILLFVEREWDLVEEDLHLFLRAFCFTS